MKDKKGKIIKRKLKQGTQILYVPSHMEYNGIEGAVLGPMAFQPGFVTSGPNNDGAYFCRYWAWSYKYQMFLPELRTKANSELTDHRNIVVYNFFTKKRVTEALRMINEGFV